MKIRLAIIAATILLAASTANAEECHVKFKQTCGDQWVAMLAGEGADPYYQCIADNRKSFGWGCKKIVDMKLDAHEKVAAGERVRYPGHYRVKRARRDLDRYDKRARGISGRRYWK